METESKDLKPGNQVSNQEVTEAAEQADEGNELVINEHKLNQYMERIRLDQNLLFGILGGTAAAVISAIAWAIITVTTEYQIGFMAIAVGLFVGFAIRYTGKGLDSIFGIMGAVLALFGCVLGNFLSIIGFVANMEGLGYMETLGYIDLALIPELLIDTFNPMDLLFYGFAVYEGYRFSFRKLTEQEIIDNAAE